MKILLPLLLSLGLAAQHGVRFPAGVAVTAIVWNNEPALVIAGSSALVAFSSSAPQQLALDVIAFGVLDSRPCASGAGFDLAFWAGLNGPRWTTTTRAQWFMTPPLLFALACSPIRTMEALAPQETSWRFTYWGAGCAWPHPEQVAVVCRVRAL